MLNTTPKSSPHITLEIVKLLASLLIHFSPAFSFSLNSEQHKSLFLFQPVQHVKP